MVWFNQTLLPNKEDKDGAEVDREDEGDAEDEDRDGCEDEDSDEGDDEDEDSDGFEDSYEDQSDNEDEDDPENEGDGVAWSCRLLMTVCTIMGPWDPQILCESLMHRLSKHTKRHPGPIKNSLSWLGSRHGACACRGPLAAPCVLVPSGSGPAPPPTPHSERTSTTSCTFSRPKIAANSV